MVSSLTAILKYTDTPLEVEKRWVRSTDMSVHKTQNIHYTEIGGLVSLYLFRDWWVVTLDQFEWDGGGHLTGGKLGKAKHCLTSRAAI